MPKATSKTFKKKKYNARFPPARIKKIMQTDEEVGKVAAAVPVIISRALEMFIESLILKTAKTTQAKNAKTLSTSHIKQTINGEKQFDFLRDLVKNVPDHQTEDNNGDAPIENELTVKKGRGRPRKSTESRKAGKRRKSGQAKVSSDTSDEEEEEEDYDIDDEEEDTDTDNETPKATMPSSNAPVNPLISTQPGQPVQIANNGAGFYQPGFSGAPAMVVPPMVPTLPTLTMAPSIAMPPMPFAAPVQPSQESGIFPPYTTPLLPGGNSVHMPVVKPTIPPPRLFVPQFQVPSQEPINLSNPYRLPALATKEDDDYDS